MTNSDWIVFTPYEEERSYYEPHTTEDSSLWLVVCAVILFLCVYFVRPDWYQLIKEKAVNIWSEKVVYVPESAQLQEKDLRFVRAYIKNRVGSKEFSNIVRDNCLDAVSYKLAVFDSTWKDMYCANEYRYIETHYKNDIMMYMTYRYESAQPESLTKRIEEFKLARK